MKGSTCAFAESILRNCGYHTGLFTSPHLIDVRERFRLDGYVPENSGVQSTCLGFFIYFQMSQQQLHLWANSIDCLFYSLIYFFDFQSRYIWREVSGILLVLLESTQGMYIACFDNVILLCWLWQAFGFLNSVSCHVSNSLIFHYLGFILWKNATSTKQEETILLLEMVALVFITHLK